MTSTPSRSRDRSAEFATVPHRTLRPGLVIENLDALPDNPLILFTLCGLTQVTGPVAPTAGRLGA